MYSQLSHYYSQPGEMGDRVNETERKTKRHLNKYRSQAKDLTKTGFSNDLVYGLFLVVGFFI